ncbi:MAG: hypothetical protein KJ592_00400 [Nanoarchaeota archaeon]|nr:hypothetical protein [Nanoarchaeota archaeon]
MVKRNSSIHTFSNMDFHNRIKIIIQYTIVTFVYLFAIFILLWMIFGNSPTFEQGILILALSLIFGLEIKTAITNTNLKNQNKSFSYLAKDFKEHRKEFQNFKQETKQEFQEIKLILKH